MQPRQIYSVVFSGIWGGKLAAGGHLERAILFSQAENHTCATRAHHILLVLLELLAVGPWNRGLKEVSALHGVTHLI